MSAQLGKDSCGSQVQQLATQARQAALAYRAQTPDVPCHVAEIAGTMNAVLEQLTAGRVSAEWRQSSGVLAVVLTVAGNVGRVPAMEWRIGGATKIYVGSPLSRLLQLADDDLRSPLPEPAYPCNVVGPMHADDEPRLHQVPNRDALVAYFYGLLTRVDSPVARLLASPLPA